MSERNLSEHYDMSNDSEVRVKSFPIVQERRNSSFDEIQPWMEIKTIEAYDVHAQEFQKLYSDEKLRRRARMGIIQPFLNLMEESVDQVIIPGRLDNLISNLKSNEPVIIDRYEIDDFPEFINDLVSHERKTYIPTVLVLGGGSGEDAADIFQEGFNVVVIEASENMATVCEKKLSQVSNKIGKLGLLEPKFKVITTTAEDYVSSTPDNLFDGIFANSLMRHLTIDKQRDLFRSFKRILKKGGIAAASLKVGENNMVVETEDFGDGHIRYSQVLTKQYAENLFFSSMLKVRGMMEASHPAAPRDWLPWYTMYGQKNGF